MACRRAASYRRAPVSAAARPLPRASPARKARGRAELPRAAPAPARPLARSPGPAPLTAAPAPGAPRPVCEARKVRRKVRVSGPACSGRRTAPPGTWKRRAGKKLHGCWWVSFSAINAQFWSSARKLIVTQTQTQATFPPHRQIKLAV